MPRRCLIPSGASRLIKSPHNRCSLSIFHHSRSYSNVEKYDQSAFYNPFPSVPRQLPNLPPRVAKTTTKYDKNSKPTAIAPTSTVLKTETIPKSLFMNFDHITDITKNSVNNQPTHTLEEILNELKNVSKKQNIKQTKYQNNKNEKNILKHSNKTINKINKKLNKSQNRSNIHWLDCEFMNKNIKIKHNMHMSKLELLQSKVIKDIKFFNENIKKKYKIFQKSINNYKYKINE